MTNAIATETRSIVVGVDGSPSSNAALAWAVRQAKLTGTPIVAVTTWEIPTSYGWEVPWPAGMDFAEDARTLLQKTIHTVLGDESSVEIKEMIVEGHAALALVDLAKDAEALVVGCRGHGAFTGMLLGSVSEYAVTHANCPVVVIHKHNEPTDS